MLSLHKDRLVRLEISWGKKTTALNQNVFALFIQVENLWLCAFPISVFLCVKIVNFFQASLDFNCWWAEYCGLHCNKSYIPKTILKTSVQNGIITTRVSFLLKTNKQQSKPSPSPKIYIIVTFHSYFTTSHLRKMLFFEEIYCQH